MREVLLLNADATPVSWLPLSIISWQNAVRLIWLDVVEILHTYDDWQVHSPSMEITVPSVVILREQVKFRNWVAREESPQTHLVFLRDNYCCQYCSKKFALKQLTIDHVLPRSHGGKTVWSNVTSACSPCNNRRGSNVRIRPLSVPYRPTIHQLIGNMRKCPIHMPQLSWNLYLQWDESLVIRSHRTETADYGDNFDELIETF